MDELLCSWLDDFLAHDLAGEERQRFVDHLAVCPRCHDAVAESQRLTGRLAEAVEQLEPVPLALAERTVRRIQVVRRRRLAVVGMALAASIALFALWLHGERTVPPPSSKNTSP